MRGTEHVNQEQMGTTNTRRAPVAGTLVILILNFLATTSARPEAAALHSRACAKHTRGHTLAAHHAYVVLRLLPNAFRRRRKLAVQPVVPEARLGEASAQAGSGTAVRDAILYQQSDISHKVVPRRVHAPSVTP